MQSSGSITFPFDLDIFSPFESRTIACMYTSLKGSLSCNSRLNMTIRATQKKRISYPVSRTDPGKKFYRSAVFSGHPKELNGNRPELNHVSVTSGSRMNSTSDLSQPSFF